ncbi:hypothetical protein PHJA_002395700 [Phtheirospermum japonicum]|uniref:Uncharacterized protein n=1 Tax=Phtheirospermum japonicum TaxID=374723 RepID=A0A830CTN1_9LAMI|nr:hypothetical protein PHJA_002395700 [Phtheirospermum japonicum]
MKIMVKVEFNCQLPLSEIGLTCDFEGLEIHLFSISIQEVLCLSIFLYMIRHYKKDNGNPTINYFISEFHSK